MGARINYVFKDLDPAVGEPTAYVVLYSHWGQTDWQPDIAAALTHARVRWNDSSYATRMMISYLIQHSILDVFVSEYYDSELVSIVLSNIVLWYVSSVYQLHCTSLIQPYSINQTPHFL